jgi:hypothetical protein
MGHTADVLGRLGEIGWRINMVMDIDPVRLRSCVSDSRRIFHDVWILPLSSNVAPSL